MSSWSPLGEKERCVVPGIIHRGRESALDVTGCVGPGIIRRGRESALAGDGSVVPGIIRRGIGFSFSDN